MSTGSSRIQAGSTTGPQIAVVSLAASFETILDLTGTPRSSVRAIGLDTPGPASADGVISSKGATNFSEVGWHGFDFRRALEAHVGRACRLQQRRQRSGACTPTTNTSVPTRQNALRSRRSSAPAWAVVSSKAARWSRAPPAWPVSSGTCTSRWKDCSSTANRCRRATVASPVTARAWHRCQRSRRTCCRSG